MSQGWSIYAAPAGAELVTDGAFAVGTDWTAGAGWAIASGVATATAATSLLEQTTITPTVGSIYRVTYTVSGYSAGSVTVALGGDTGTARTADGTYTEYLTAVSTTHLTFSASAATLSVDDVSVVESDTITFNDAPAAGTNNITVAEYASGQYNATPIFAVGAWNSAYGYPGEVEFYADRLVFAGTTSQPQTMWLSRIGDYSMFGKSTPILDDDAIIATVNARQLNKVTDLIPKQHLLALTTGGVWKIGGGDSEVLTPSTINARPQPSTGSSDLPALDVGDTAIYFTNKGGQVRDLSYTFEADGYAGSDLTAFASHLIEHRTLVDWCYADVPYSIVIAVGDDGVALSMTYKREHQVVAWGWHDTQGQFESACSIPEDGETGAYVVVKRTVNGQTRRYIERFADARVDDLREAVGVDSSLSYDGRNTTAKTLTLAGGATPDALVTVTASSATFAASNVGDAVVLDYDGEPLVITLTEYTSATVVKGYPSRTLVAADLAPGTDWALAVDTFSGLDHLEGCTVAIAADGMDAGTAVVTGGRVTVSPPGVLVHVGLAFTSEFESLDMQLVGGESVGTRQKLIREIGILVKDTRGIEAGTSFDHMETLKPRDSEAMTQAPAARTEWVTLNVSGEWQKNPRVCIRNNTPIPHTILAIEPQVEFGR